MGLQKDLPGKDPGALPLSGEHQAGKTEHEHPAGDEGASDDPDRPDRREALAKMAGLAAYVGPAMTVLIAGSAEAHHKPWHTANCRNFPDSPFCLSPA